MSKRGYLYLASGPETYTKEAINSAQSLRKVGGNPHITLITDKETNNSVFDEIKVFESSRKGWKENLGFKVKHIYKDSPYDETIFIDTDTYFCENCDELWNILKYFDLLMNPTPSDPRVPEIDGKLLNGCYAYCTGMIVYKKNEKNDYLFDKWHQIEKMRQGELHHNDQKSFMEALLLSESRIYALRANYNLRVPYFCNLTHKVKVIHGKLFDINYEKMSAEVNRHTKYRCWNPMKHKCERYDGRKVKKMTKRILFRYLSRLKRAVMPK